jgi:hypothetical protein
MGVRGLIACVATILALSAAGVADAKPRSGHIDVNKGIAGVNLGLRRGPIVVRKGKSVHTVRTVASLLGKPQSVHELPRDQGETEGEKSVYLANYTDDRLSVYYSKRNSKGAIDSKRDRYDKVFGVVTYTSRYDGPFMPGDGVATSRDDKCAPLDAHVAPDGGPRRVSACPLDPSGNAFDIVFLSGGSPSRGGQRITQLGIYNSGFGVLLFQSLMAGALQDLNCENPQCTASE